MEEMGDDEVFALLGSLIVGVVAAAMWYFRALLVSRLGGAGAARSLLLLAPIAALVGLESALVTGAAADVREDGRYQFLFVAMGSIWVFVLPRALSFVGISFRDDALERRNAAAQIAIAGAVIGLSILFTGSNMGEGPSIWNPVETAIAATAFLGATVLVLALATAIGDTIAVERDVATGVRFAGWLAAAGIVLGRAAAGDWEGESAMIGDLASIGWPVLVLLFAAIAAERAMRPTVTSPRPPVVLAGLVPGLAYVAVSLAYVAALPHWSE